MMLVSAIAATLATLSTSSSGVSAQGLQKFDMTDPKTVSGLTFVIESELEPILGQTNAISGELQFDATKPENSTGKIIVQTGSVTTASPAMTSAMQGDWCLAPKKYPTIEFEVKGIKNVKKVKANSWKGTVQGDFSLHGVTKSVEAIAAVSYLPGKLASRGGVEGKNGDLLVVRASFSFNRRDFNLAKDLSSELVGDIIEVKIASVGVCIK